MALFNSSSAGVIGGGSFFARSVIEVLITDVASTAGRPAYFAAASAGGAASFIRAATAAGSNFTTSPMTVTYAPGCTGEVSSGATISTSCGARADPRAVGLDAGAVAGRA